MSPRRFSSESFAFVLALALMAAIGWVSYQSMVSAAEETVSMDDTQEVLLLLSETRLAMREGLAFQRTYLLTGDERFLLAFGRRNSDVPRYLRILRKLEAENPVQAVRIAALEDRLLARIQRLEEEVRQRSEGEPSRKLDAESEFREQQAIAAAFEAVQNEEVRLLGVRSTATARSLRKTKVVLVAGNTLAFGLLLWAFGKLRRDNLARRRAEEALSLANEQLSEHVREAEERRREIELLAEMTAGLHSCLQLEEMNGVMRQVSRRIWPQTSGAIYLSFSSQAGLQRTAWWPESHLAQESFPASDCWALRRGQLNHFRAGAAGQRCAHHPESAETLCVPLVAGEEVVGVLVSEAEAGKAPKEWIRVVAAASGPIGLAASNLRLRERLRAESVRDPLTGLFNRRYLEEILEKECARATRSGKPIGLIFADLDHFKQVNDTEGHPAGDAVLREFGAVLRDSVRGGDFACRWGGEEFVLVLPESPAEMTVRRAEGLRRSLQEFRVVHEGRRLEPVTVSFGVAAFPVHGTSPDELIRAADEALYRAKIAGRNRVVLATDVWAHVEKRGEGEEGRGEALLEEEKG